MYKYEHEAIEYTHHSLRKHVNRLELVKRHAIKIRTCLTIQSVVPKMSCSDMKCCPQLLLKCGKT